jgi:hypothetical protein
MKIRFCIQYIDTNFVFVLIETVLWIPAIFLPEIFFSTGRLSQCFYLHIKEITVFMDVFSSVVVPNYVLFGLELRIQKIFFSDMDLDPHHVSYKKYSGTK